MASEKLLYKNIDLWAPRHPQAAVRLPYIDCDHITFCKTRKGELNLHYHTKERSFYYHSSTDAAQESRRWFSKLNLDQIELLYVYGIGLGYDYVTLKAWLKKAPNRRVVFLENDLAVIHRFFETPLATQLLKHPQVMLHYFEGLDEPRSPLTELYWSFMTTNMTISALRCYAKQRPTEYRELEHKLLYDATLRHALVEEYLSYGVSFFRNFYPNLLSLPGSYLGDALANKFQGVPAIICGAGPSLNKQFQLLGQLTDKALIFAGGSALNVLTEAKIAPHLGAGVDPNPEQYKRLQSTIPTLPFLYRNRLYHEALKLVEGPRLYITGSGGYDVAAWIEEQLDLTSAQVEEGFNVVNFCIDIARVWGCNPIVLVGMDLAFTDMEAYAKGVIKKSKVSRSSLQGEDLDSTAILRPDIFGHPVYTLWKWIAESYWIGDFAKEYPEITLLNATEGGIGFPGVENVSLEAVAKAHLQESCQPKERLQKEMQGATIPHVTKEKVIEVMRALQDSLNRCQSQLEILIMEAEKVAKEIENTQVVPTTTQSGRAALCETELAEEPAYQAVLEVFNIVYSKVLNHELQSLLREEGVQAAINKIRLNIRRLTFLRDVAAANSALIEHSLA